MNESLLTGRSVLVIEDEMLVQMLTEAMLEDLGCENVTIAGSVEQALSLIDEQGFDAATLDLNLNGRESFPVADALAAHGVPFCFATGYGGRMLKDGYRDLPVLTKPFRTGDLIAILVRLLPSPSIGPARSGGERRPSEALQDR